MEEVPLGTLSWEKGSGSRLPTSSKASCTCSLPETWQSALGGAREKKTCGSRDTCANICQNSHSDQAKSPRLIDRTEKSKYSLICTMPKKQ